MHRGPPVAPPGPISWDLPDEDVDQGIDRALSDLKGLSGARILVTGGTGFLGSWLVASLARANSRLGLGMRITVLTRDPSAVKLQEAPSLSILRGDIRSLPDLGSVDVIVHGAATSSSTYGVGDGDPKRMIDTIVDGTRSVLAQASSTRARVLFLSSGAVYGTQTAPVSEAVMTAPDPLLPGSAYAEAKRLAENLCAVATEAGEADAVVARLFAFIGPRIPLQAHFAAGNFLDDVMHGRSVVVQGDGRARRSYLYAGDLPEWCWALLARGRGGAAYNVGSPAEVTVGELAHRIAALGSGPIDVQVLGAASEQPAHCYVPVTDRAEEELGLRVVTSLEDALRKTYRWLIGRP